MEYKSHTAMSPPDAKAAIEKYKKSRKGRDWLLSWYACLYCKYLLE